MRVTFESRADFDPDAAYTGTPYTHPKWDGFPDFPDVGVVVLDEAVDTGAGYGRLPEAGIVERFETGKELLTVVGYGVNGFDIGSEPPLQPQPVLLADRSRATVRLLNTKDPDVGDQYVKTSGIGIIGGGEGSCYGDSGGPLLPQHMQLPSCAGTGLLPTDEPTGGLKVGLLVPLIP